MEQNPSGVCLVKDELSGWFGNFDAYRRGRESKDLPFWLSVHGGQYYRSNRKTGKQLTIAATPSISICGGIQPGILHKTLSENKHYFDAGLVARILFAMPPDLPQHWTEAVVSESTKLQYQKIIESIISLRSRDRGTKRTPENPFIVTLSEPAKRLFIDFYNENADERAGMKSDTQKAFWPKLTGYAARITLVFHVVKWQEGESDIDKVDEATMAAAIRLVQWYKRESLRIVELILREAAQVDLEAAAILEAIKRKGGEITVRELQQTKRSYRNRGGAEFAAAKLNEMVTKGLLTTRFDKSEHGPGTVVFQLVTAGNGNG